MTSDERRLLERLAPWIARAGGFSGWSFSSLGVRPLDSGPPWDYDALARKQLARARRVLDMDTGGGERLSSLAKGSQGRVVATEAWAPNVAVAARRLTPLGVSVVRANGERLPFDADAFDLVLNRHGALDPSEVARVLQPGGAFLTQQIGPNHLRELDRHLPRGPVTRRDRRPAYASQLEAAGLRVAAFEHDHRVAYPSLGELVFVLLVTPWTVPGFDPVTHAQELLRFEADHLTDEGVVVTESHFLLVAEDLRPGVVPGDP